MAVTDPSPMARKAPAPQAHFNLPLRQITTMLIVLGLVAVGCYFIFPALEPVLLSNPFLNGVILAVFGIGVLACFWQVAQLIGSVRWIEAFAAGQTDTTTVPPRLLLALAALLRTRGREMEISATSSATILDSVATRIEEARDITRYLVNLLIFLGLLGTFYGLATTVPAVVETIRSLVPQEGEEGAAVFGRLLTGLEAQLGGMGTAFASSLLGLAGSLVVGLLELFASQSQNRFYRELEEWLSSITRLGVAGVSDFEGGGDGGQTAGLVEYMARQMDDLSTVIARAETGRAEMDARMALLADGVERLTAALERESAGTGVALTRLAETQERIAHSQDTAAQSQDRFAASQDATAQALEQMAHAQAQLAEALSAQPAPQADAGLYAGEGDPESRMHLRSIDTQILRLMEEVAAGRQEAVADLRTDLQVLIRELRKQRREAATLRPDAVDGD